MSRHDRPWFGFERRHEPLAPLHVFRGRLIRSGGVAAVIILVSLAIGMVGYRMFGGLESWVDCLYAASMILGGMGPVADMKTDAGKVFASVYALYSGVVLLASVGVLIAPALHRILHRFHIETGSD
jgi:hypothetical protein